MNLPQDQKARTRLANDVWTNLLAEAGAGTGKTEVMVRRVLELTCYRTENPLSLERLVAITFTEKAAGELKERLRRRVEELVHTPSTEETVRRNARNVLGQMDRANITTIHGFCSTLLRHYAVEARIDPTFTVVDDLQRSALRDQVWQEWFDRLLARPESDPVLQRYVRLRGWGYSDAALQELYEEMSRKWRFRSWLPEVEHTPVSESFPAAVRQLRQDLSGEVLPGNALHDIFDRVVQCWEATVHIDEEDLEQILLELNISALKNNKFSEFKPSLPEEWVPYFPAKNPQHSKAYDRFIIAPDSLLAGSKEWYNQRRFHYYGLFLEEIVEHLRYRRLVECLDFVEEPVLAFQARKRREGLVDFDDLLVLTRDLLAGNKAVRGRVQQSYDQVMIDEFQDTDPLQAEIACYLCEAAPVADSWPQAMLQQGKLFLVGDPKQSIYRFRNADMQTFLQMKRMLETQSGVHGGRESLTQNFRTDQNLLECLNSVFKELMPSETDYQAAYEPLNGAWMTPYEHVPVRLVTVPTIQTTSGRGMAPTHANEARLIAQYLIREVGSGRMQVRDGAGAKPLSGKPYPLRPARLSDVAILFRTYGQMVEYERAFREAGLPYQVVGGRTFYTNLEIQTLTSVLSALLRPDDEVAVVSVLKSAAFGFSDEDLLAYHAAGGSWNYFLPVGSLAGLEPGLVTDLEGAFVALRRWYRRSREGRFVQLVADIFEQTRLLLHFGVSEGGARAVANLEKALAIARLFEDEGLDFFRFVEELRSNVEEVREEEELVSLDGDGEAVRFLTIHKSKGLQFPVVILGAATKENRIQDRGYSFCMDFLQQRMSMKTGPKLRKLHSVHYDRVFERDEKPHQEAEGLRLLYVAATRVESVLILPLVEKQDNTLYGNLIKGLEELSKGEDELAAAVLVELPPEVEGQPDLRWEPPTPPLPRGQVLAQIAALLAEPPLGARARALPAESGPLLLSPTKLVEYLGAGKAGKRGAPTSADDGERSLALGRIVHELFQHHGAAALDLGEVQLRGWCLREGQPGALPAVREMLAGAAALGLRERFGAARRVLREVPFLLNLAWPGLPEVQLEGVIDLLIETEQGWELLDYKTNGLSAAEMPGWVQTHQGQLWLYAWAFERLSGGAQVSRAAFLLLGPQVEAEVALPPDPEGWLRGVVADGLRDGAWRG